jgi:hypothetical protein
MEGAGEPKKTDDARIGPSMENPPLTASGIATLEQEKATRSAAQQKLDSNIVLALRQSRGEPPFDRTVALQPALPVRQDGCVLVDLDATVSPDLLVYIRSIGGEIINSFATARAVRAFIPLKQMETLAARADVKFISPAAVATTNPIAAPPVK